MKKKISVTLCAVIMCHIAMGQTDWRAMIISGSASNKEHVASMSYVKEAAEEGDLDAKYLLALEATIWPEDYPELNGWEMIIELANSGFSQAQASLGISTVYGEQSVFVLNDGVQSIRFPWMSSIPISLTSYRWGAIITNNVHTTVDEAMGQELLRKAGKDFPPASIVLGDFDVSESLSLEEKVSLLEPFVNQEGLVWYELFNLFTDGDFVEPDEERAFSYLFQAANAGEIWAQYYLSLYKLGIQKSEIVPEDSEDGMKLLRSSAEQGLPKAQWLYGAELLDRNVGKTQNKKGIYWLKKAANSGVKEAMRDLSDIYMVGMYDIEADKESSLQWINEALTFNETRDINDFLKRVDIYFIFKDWKEGEKYLNELDDICQGAQVSDASILREIGKRYMFNLAPNGFPEGSKEYNRNLKKGFEYYKKSADLGDAESQYICGLCYGLGKGVRENHMMSHKYYAMSARNGYEKAIEHCTKFGYSF